MTVDAPERLLDQPGNGAETETNGTEGSRRLVEPGQGAVEEPPVGVAFTCLVSLLSSAAAAYASASVFDGIAPIPVAIVGAVLGSGMVWFSFRTSRPAVVQFLIAPVAAVAGSLLLLPDASGGTANLPSLVVEALRSGGIAQPPVPFDPGWRFLLVVTMAVVAGGTAAVATGLNRVRLAVFLPVPLLFGGLMAQSGNASLVPTIVSLVLLVAALAVAFGVDLAREGATSGRFELRRLGKGAVSLLALIALLAGITQLDFLFPEAAASRVVPPQRPEAPPPEPDRELFTVESPRQVPWRVGVLDVYDGRGWLTPPFDTTRLVEIEGDGSVPEVSDVPGAPIGPVVGADAGSGDRLSVTFNISDIRGHVVPAVANPSDIDASGFNIQYDPRTQTLRLPTERASSGMTYTLQAPLPPTGEDLAKAGPPPEEMDEFLSVPPPPPQVQNVISQAPEGVDLFTRLQFVREQLYEKVVAKGAGQAIDVLPTRVVELMSGDPGTPFEITAAEALLARWVGVPSRLGYGYFGGDDVGGNVLSIRPDDGATWLEVYFQDYGWVPIVGTPPRAQSSLGSADKNYDSSVRPAENLTLFSYVPVRERSVPLLYTIVQYWVGRIAPIVLLLGLAMWLYPGLVKVERRRRRAQWGRERGRGEQILTAYAEFRDSAFDLGLGHPTLTPIEFVSAIEDDNEHRELAWLVTRALWGDLARDVREDDVFVADEMARSMTTRLRATQSGMNRVFAFASRNSLKDPFTDEVPNLWWPAADPSASLFSRARKRIALGMSVFRVMRRAQPAAAAVVLTLLLSGCVQQADLTVQASAPLPERIVPSSLDGITFRREEAMERPYSKPDPDSLVSDARVFSVLEGSEIVAAMQIVAFKRTLVDREREARAGVLEGLGGQQFELQRVGNELVYVERLPEQQFFLWFPPEGAYYEMFVARGDYEDASETFARILAYQQGEEAEEIVLPPDPRRGFEG